MAKKYAPRTLEDTVLKALAIAALALSLASSVYVYREVAELKGVLQNHRDTIMQVIDAINTLHPVEQVEEK